MLPCFPCFNHFVFCVRLREQSPFLDLTDWKDLNLGVSVKVLDWWYVGVLLQKSIATLTSEEFGSALRKTYVFPQ